VRTVALADGSELNLNGETEVMIRMDRRTRRIDLVHGELSIDVAHERRPLAVWADDASMTAVGTVFNVDRRADGLVVSVTEGIVEVTRRGWSPVRVPAGRAARVTDDGVAVTDSDPMAAASWREGAIATAGLPIPDLAHALERYTEREIVIAPELENEVVAGRFSLTQPDRTLRLLAAAYDLELREEPTQFVLSPAGH
jgi:transmembrane sensor